MRTYLIPALTALSYVVNPVTPLSATSAIAPEQTAVQAQVVDGISSCGSTCMAVDDTIVIGNGTDSRTGYDAAVDRFCTMVDGATVPSQGYLSVATETYISGGGSGQPPATYGILGFVYFEIHNKISSAHTADYASCKQYLGTLSAPGSQCLCSTTTNGDAATTKGGTYQVGDNGISYHALANFVPPAQDALDTIYTSGAISAQTVNKFAGAPLDPWPYGSTDGVRPVACHSHNDYDQDIPLFSALAAGCVGVEVDVWLVGSALYIGHTLPLPGRTMTAQYVEPLLAILDRNGSVWPAATAAQPQPQSLDLLIDFKTSLPGTLDAVVAALQPLRDAGYLSRVVNGDKFVPGAVTVIASGSAPFDRISAGDGVPDRDVFYDAPVDRLLLAGKNDDDYDYSALNSYYASADFQEVVGSPDSADDFSEAQRELVAAQVREAHDRGLIVRYYNLPGDYLWEPLAALGVDRLNADDLQATARIPRL
ncbi:hypothetical protein F4778DRAFT_279438 [Xylariomycetidae sp. FL2044]|nr:hypothetical protein F4778DRAFT_279438 [Xylariomycetidae sp. FL2044]